MQLVLCDLGNVNIFFAFHGAGAFKLIKNNSVLLNNGTVRFGRGTHYCIGFRNDNLLIVSMSYLHYLVVA